MNATTSLLFLKPDLDAPDVENCDGRSWGTTSLTLLEKKREGDHPADVVLHPFTHRQIPKNIERNKRAINSRYKWYTHSG